MHELIELLERMFPSNICNTGLVRFYISKNCFFEIYEDEYIIGVKIEKQTKKFYRETSLEEMMSLMKPKNRKAIAFNLDLFKDNWVDGL